LIGASVSGSSCDLVCFFHIRGPRLRRPGAGPVATSSAPPNAAGGGLCLMATLSWRGTRADYRYDRPIRVSFTCSMALGQANGSEVEARRDQSDQRRQPYGYFWLGKTACLVEYSKTRTSGLSGKLMRLGATSTVRGSILSMLGQSARASAVREIVWTHTESQYLAVLLLFQARRRAQTAEKDRAERLVV